MSAKNKNEEKESCDQRNPKWVCPPPLNVTHPLRYYEFTPEEMKALEECDKESFYQRCLPFSTLFAAATYAGVKHGMLIVDTGTPLKLHRRFLAKSPHFGAFPKVILAVIIGHCYGRVSFIAECEKKLRRLPNNSHLGNVMRQYNREKNPPQKSK